MVATKSMDWSIVPHSHHSRIEHLRIALHSIPSTRPIAVPRSLNYLYRWREKIVWISLSGEWFHFRGRSDLPRLESLNCMPDSIAIGLQAFNKSELPFKLLAFVPLAWWGGEADMRRRFVELSKWWWDASRSRSLSRSERLCWCGDGGVDERRRCILLCDDKCDCCNCECNCCSDDWDTAFFDIGIP